MRGIRVTYDNGQTISTSINGTEEEIRKYYIGQSFNFGDTEAHPKDDVHRAVSVEFLPMEEGQPESIHAHDAQPMSAGMYLELFHGRKTQSEELDNWGELGPVFGPLQFAHVTYCEDIKMQTAISNGQSGEDHELQISEGLVYYDGMLYGDFSTFVYDPNNLHTEHEELTARLTAFDNTKSTPPTEEHA